MCCFSGTVTLVDNTRIFARRVDDRAQSLAYAMRVAADADLAMVLPLPTDPAAGEAAVTFVDLSAEPYFFSALDALFPMDDLSLSPQSIPKPASRGAPLAVHAVGAFEASFVPSADDFDRLDARFRLAPAVVEGLAARDRFGFAVFQLRGLGPSPAPEAPWWRRVFAGDAPPRPPASFHPMAMTFRSREPEVLFLPTVHAHDGTLPPTARFDHTLYVQGAPDGAWAQSEATPHRDLVTRARGILGADARVHRRAMKGELPNVDVRVPA